MGERMIQLPENVFEKLCDTLTDFEDATDDPYNDDYLSDGEWLDVFYNLAIKIHDSIVK